MNDHTNLPAIQQRGVETYRASTDAAALCGDIVKATAMSIQGRKYVKVEGWQAIAIAHGCVVSARDVERVEGGFRAIGEVRRMHDGALLSSGEGFLGDDEPMWAKRPVFARRAMVQTRAMSRACRTAFAHVVVMIDRNLSTTPAEEMEGIDQTGEHSWTSEARKDGLIKGGETRSQYQVDREKTAPAREAAAAEKAKTWTDQAIQVLNTAEWPTDAVGEFWRENAKKIEWLEENAPAQHERFLLAYENARERAASRAGTA